MDETLRLLLGTVLLRPYVFAFLAVYLAAAAIHLGWRQTLVFTPVGYAIAWVSEFASIHWGFPYGDYYYIPTTVGRELWVLGVPFMDSLSYVFLAYCSYSMAIFLLSPTLFTKRQIYILETHSLRRSWQTLALGAFLFVLLDIIIDPVALQGHRWFLGQIYGYRSPGLYFGIPMSNFGGWLLVGFAMIGALQMLDRFPSLHSQGGLAYHGIPGVKLLGPILYVSVIVFNLIVTFRIGEMLLGITGCLIIFHPALLALFFSIYKQKHLTQDMILRHLEEFPFGRSQTGSQLFPFLPSEPALGAQFCECVGGDPQENL